MMKQAMLSSTKSATDDLTTQANMLIVPKGADGKQDFLLRRRVADSIAKFATRLSWMTETAHVATEGQTNHRGKLSNTRQHQPPRTLAIRSQSYAFRNST